MTGKRKSQINQPPTSESEIPFRGFFENLSDAVQILDDFTFVDCNQATVKLLHAKNKDEVMATHPSQLSPEFQPDGRRSDEKADEMIRTALEKGGHRFEWMHRRVDGEDFPVEVMLTPVVIGDKTILYSSWRDIADRKQMERKLNESEERYRRLSDATVEGIVLHDKGILFDANEVFAKMFGYDLSEVIGMPATEFLTPETREITAQNIRSGYEKPYEVMGLRKDGSTFPVEITGKAMPYEGRTVRVTALRDITERKQAETKVREAQQLLESFLENFPDAAWAKDLEGHFLIANRYLVKDIYGAALDEVLGKTVYDLFPKETADFVWGSEQQITRTGETLSIEEAIPQADGKTYNKITTKFPLYDSDGNINGVGGVLIDITERKQLEAQVQQAFERRGYQVQVSTEISQEIASAANLGDLFNRVVTLTKERLGYYHTQLLRYDPAQDAVVLVTGYGETGQKMLESAHQMPMGKGLIGTAAETGQTVMRANLADDPDWQPNPLLPETRGEIAVPIKFGEQILGVLDVQSNQAGALTDDDRLLLEGLCGQIAIALQNAQLVDQTQTALASVLESQSALNEVMVVAGMANWKLSFETFRFTFNDRFYQMLGTTVEEEGGYELAADDYTKRYIHPEDAGLIAGAIQDALQNPTPQTFKGSLEYRLIRKDGQIRYILTDYRLVVNEQGSAIGGVGSFLDITERKQAEEALRRSEAQLSEALKLAKLGYWEYDAERDRLIFNDQFYSIFHTTAEQAGGYEISAAQYAQQFVHPGDLAVVNTELGKAFNSTERHYNHRLEHRILFADGDVGHISVSVNAEHDEQGHLLRIYGANQDITERKQAEEAVAKRAAELATVAEVSTTTTTVLDPEQLLQLVTDVTKERFGLYHAHIYLVDADGDSLTLTAGAGEVGRKMTAQGWQIPLDRERSLVARAARTRQGVIINDVRAEPDFLPNELLPETRAEMAVPVIVGDKVLGVFDVQSDQPGRFSQEDANIYTTLTAQVGVALQNAQSYSEVQDQEKLMRTIIDSTPDWIFIKDQQHRYRLVNQGYATSLHLMPEDFIGKNDLELGFPEELVKGNPEKGIDGFWVDDRRVMDGGEAKVIPNDLVMIDNVLHNFNTIKTPLRDAAGSVWGVLAFGRDITELMTLEQALSRRATQLATVADVSTAVATILSPEKLLQTVVDTTKEQFSLYHAHIYLLDADGAGLTLTAGAGEVGQQMTAQGWQIPLDQERSLVARAARARHGVIINDVQAEPDFMPNELLPETRAEMAVPMIAGDKVLGVFDIQSDKPGSFSQEDASIYTTLAAQVGIALQNARLFDQTQAALAQSDKLFETSRSLTQAADLQELVKAAVEALNIPLINRAVLGVFDYGAEGEFMSMTIAANWWNGVGHEATAIGTNYPVEVFRTVSLFASPIPIFFNDAFTDSRADAATLGLAKRLNLRAVAVLPLYLGSRQIGVLMLEAETPHNFSQDEIRLFSALAPQIATVLENRRQFEQAQKQAERESTLNIISQKIQSANTVEAALQIAARELGRALGAPLTIAQIGLKEQGHNGSRN